MPTKKKKLSQTPLMRQYFGMKAKHPDAILLFRVGDFYETFGEDAIKASKILGIVLTHRNNGGSNIELAGFPHHSLDVYLPKLVRSGYRVAICDQLEKPSKEKKIVKRGITEIVTPGLTTNDKVLDQNTNNFLASVHFLNQSRIGLALLDLSTGEFCVCEGDQYEIERQLMSYAPSEVILSKSLSKSFQKYFGEAFYCFGMEEWVFQPEFTLERLRSHFQVEKLKGFGIEELDFAQIAAGAILYYLDQTENKQLLHVHSVKRLESHRYVWLDKFTIRNLELIDSLHPTGKSLLEILDETATPMGARLLKRWILYPLISLSEIEKRHKRVEAFYKNPLITSEIFSELRLVGDLERLISKVSMRKVNPRELNHLKKSLKRLPELGQKLKDIDSSNESIENNFRHSKHVIKKIEKYLDPEAPVAFKKAPVIAAGCNADLDEIRDVISNSKEMLLDIQMREAEKTGITKLKIGFNNVFGYYLEVTNKYKHLDLIPEDWIRKQTLTNSERYITAELKELEDKILNAQSRIDELEAELYQLLLDELAIHIIEIQTTAEILAEIDCLSNFARISTSRQYVRPVLNESMAMNLKAARHPVIELQLEDGKQYIPNDLFLDPDSEQILMITGPNMSGKSALLRQAALTCLLAQIGCFVAAESAEIGIVDKIFTRVGASDNISSGESTFMVEMSETASIMNNMSPRSLIILDEIGRGTSTYDGISIAWSIAEYLHHHKTCHPKTLFATHYHELNELAKKYSRVKNYHISTEETGSKVVFLRKLVAGGSEHSFGIHVAKMAGMPLWIIKRAYDMLKGLESQRVDASSNTISSVDKLQVKTEQLSMFGSGEKESSKLIREKLETIDINTLTPIECLLQLSELIKMLDED